MEKAIMLRRACQVNAVGAVALMLKSPTPEMFEGLPQFDNETALHAAVHQDAVKCVRLLLRNGRFGINQGEGRYSMTPCHVAALAESDRSFVLLLLYGADSGRVDITGLRVSTAGLRVFDRHVQLRRRRNTSSANLFLVLVAGTSLYEDGVFALREVRGTDPEDAASVADAYRMICDAKEVADKKSCAMTVRFLCDATRGWYPTTHHLYCKTFRAAVAHCLLAARRCTLQMPPEMWYHVLHYYPRSVLHT
mgnify:CR=1 FL=1